MADTKEIITMYCGKCKESFSVLREWEEMVKCPKCDGTLAKIESKSPVKTMPEMNPNDLIGSVLGGCTIKELIGRGSMGFVFSAIHTGLSRTVALKVLPVTEDNRPILKRLIFEARTIAQLDHPNIVQVYDVGIHQQYVFIIMQFIDGQSLASLLDEMNLPEGDALRIIKQVALGLAQAHSRGIIHRDLKAENVMVTKDNVVKIMDFGLAHRVGTRDEMAQYVVGTPHYIAPEQWLGRDVDGRADIYSLGCLMYYVITGHLPFENVHGISDLMKAHIKHIPTNPKIYRPGLSNKLNAIIRKCLAKDPNKRYQKAEALISDIEKYEGGGDPDALKDFGTYVKCQFCDTLNPAGNQRCKICNEPLQSKPHKLEIDDKEDFRCNACGEPNSRNNRSCKRCRKAFCARCGTRVAVLHGVCQFCFKSVRR